MPMLTSLFALSAAKIRACVTNQCTKGKCVQTIFFLIVGLFGLYFSSLFGNMGYFRSSLQIFFSEKVFFPEKVFLKSWTKLTENSCMAESFSKSFLAYNLYISITGLSMDIYATFQKISSGEHI